MRYAKVDFDTVAPLQPFDRTASQVSQKGTEYEFSPEPHILHSKNPIPVRPFTKSEMIDPNFVDHTGVRIGRLVVIGRQDKRDSDKGRRWVVRCVCGSYEVRSTKYIAKCVSGENPGQHDPSCAWCDRTRKLQQGHYKKDKYKIDAKTGEVIK